MNESATSRRSLLVQAALFAGALGGCSTARVTRSPESSERQAFIEKAMFEVRQQVAAQEEELGRRQSGAVLQVATLTPFGDWDYYFVRGGAIIWRPNPGQTFRTVEVPEGFVCDLTSVPRVFWQAMRPEGRYAYAAVVHDYLYWMQDRSREEADRIFRFALEDSKVDSTIIAGIYSAVSLVGQSSWDQNRKLKDKGERRILKRFPSDFTTSWAEWKTQPDVFR